MLGERSDQRGLQEADRLYLDLVGGDTFYGLFASLRRQVFQDADFAVLYCPDNGRASVAPSLLATALLLRAHDKASDAEAKARVDRYIRWKVALGIEIEDRPFAKSVFRVSRAQTILRDVSFWLRLATVELMWGVPTDTKRNLAGESGVRFGSSG